MLSGEGHGLVEKVEMVAQVSIKKSTKVGFFSKDWCSHELREEIG